jgi:exonuclease III
LRLVTWNVAHQARPRIIRPDLPSAIASLTPDIVVLTEYVVGASHQFFVDALTAHGLSQVCISAEVKGQNQVLIASRPAIKEGDIRAPDLAPQVPSNLLHVRLCSVRLELIGLRVPMFAAAAQKWAYWDWLAAAAESLRGRPCVILGDFNADPTSTTSASGARLRELASRGWHLALPARGWSFRSHAGRESRIDHALVSPALGLVRSQYVADRGGFHFAGPNKGALSDHAPLLLTLRDIELR